MTDMEQACESWQKMIDGGTGILCPAHGKPFSVDKLKHYKGRIKTKDLITFFRQAKIPGGDHQPDRIEDQTVPPDGIGDRGCSIERVANMK